MEMNKGKDDLTVNIVRAKDGSSSLCTFKKRKQEPGSSRVTSQYEGAGGVSVVEQNNIAKRSKTGSLEGGQLSGGSSSSSISTLHASSLNSPRTTVKDLYVDSQNRYRVTKRIAKIQNCKFGVTVTYMITSEADGSERKLTLKDMWSELDWLRPETLINIIGVSVDENNTYVVERLRGYVIVEPDQLISVTSIISQLYCERKTALSRFYLNKDSAVTFRGVIAHELICHAMREKLSTIDDLKKAVEAICQWPPMLERAYGLQMSDDELQKIQTDVCSWVHRFMCQRFLASKNTKNPKYQNFTFKDVLGVEDNIWNPRLGLKGKIDATVLIEQDGKLKITPLEFKTGSTKSQSRQNIKADHVGQVTLYTLMMKIKFGTVQEALLYYISDDSLTLHPPRKLELQQLVLKRNLYVKHSTIVNGDLPFLPKPDGIDFEFKCTGCELKNVCTHYIKKATNPERNTKVILQMNGTERKLVESCKLKKVELKFMERWVEVINYETEEVEKKFNDKYLWLKSPQEREAAGTCITDLKIFGEPCAWKDSKGKTAYLVSFVRRVGSDSQSQKKSVLQIDDFITLSSNVEVCINYGVVAIIRGEEITISLDQPLHPEYQSANFIYSVDKINSKSPIASQYGYLARLMDDTPESARLREYIILKAQPKFTKAPLPDSGLQEILQNLNVEQKRVIMKAFSTDSFLFVKGTPGSGKTTTIVSLLRALMLKNHSVLVVSYTGTALVNILDKYKKYSDNFIKISSSGRNDASLAPCTTKELSKSAKSISDLQGLYHQPIVGTTLLSLKHPIFQVRRFDYCIVDEASQALPTAVFGALSLCEKYIVFGDPNQLPPVLQSDIVKDPTISDNFFSLMASPVSTIKLNIQYRMNSTITKIANALMYDNQMKCGDPAQEKSYIKLAEPDIRSYLKESVSSVPARRVLCHVVSKKLSRSVVFMDTSNVSAYESRVGETIRNEAEKSIVISCVRMFVGSKLDPSALGIIAPYRGQVNFIRSALKEMVDEKCHDIEVNTVDQYQGREMEVIICSFTKSKPKSSSFFRGGEVDAEGDGDGDAEENQDNDGKESILQDIRRLNVAITRARRKLVLIGNRETLVMYKPFKKLFEILEEDQVRQISSEELNGLEQLADNGNQGSLSA